MSIGATTASTGAFTTLSASSTVTLSGGTINGVAYLNGSNVLTTGSALTFNGTDFATTGKVASGTTGAAGRFDLARASDGGVVVALGLSGNDFSANNGAGGSYIFNINSSETLRLNSTSLYTASTINVGIGTSSPAYKLDVTGTINSGASTATGYNLVFRTSGVTTGRVQTAITNTSGDFYTGIEGSTAGQTLTGSAAYSAFAGTFTANPLYLVTNGIIRTTIDSSGNLGIGTSSIDERLCVVNTGTFAAVRVSNGTNSSYFGYANADTNYNSDAKAGDAIIRGFNGVSIAGGGGAGGMRLDSSGNLGLGVTPSVWNTIKPIEIARAGSFVGANSSGSTYLGANTRFASNWIYANNGPSGLYTIEDNTHFWRTAPSGTAGNAISFTQAMTLDASGNLVVGDTSTARRFKTQFDSNTVYSAADFETTSLQCYIRNASSTIGAYTGIQFAVGNNGDAAISAIRTADGESALAFGTRGGGSRLERARIDSSGNLLVKWTAYNGASNTAGAGINPVGQIAVERDGGIAGVFNRFSSDGQLLVFRRQGTTVGSIDVTTTGVTLTGTNGITFTAAQTASADVNTLDDYEEGTWTPIDSSGAGLSFTIIGTSTYTKIGRQVICRAGLTYPTTASGSNAVIGGLPFGTGSNGPASGQMFVSATNAAVTIQGGYVPSASTLVTLAGPTGGLVSNASMSAAIVYFTVIYST
jgi:hypothetical protein